MPSFFCKQKCSWRHFQRYRQGSLRLRSILLFLIMIELFILIWVIFQPVRFVSQVYSGWEYEFDCENSIYGLKVRLKDGEIDVYRVEKILQ